ncbi:MAG: NfeD family protein [Anaerolineaceae bacterium]
MEFLLDPNVAFVVLAVAFFMVIFALLTPGTGFLEILALVLLTLVGYSVANLAVNAWAIVLLLAGVVLVLIALRRAWKWYFLAGSIVCVIVGLLFVYQSAGSLLAMDPLLAVFLSLGMGIFIWIVGRNTSTAFNLNPSSDPDQVIGMTGKALTDITAKGSVYVDGENWSAIADSRIPKGSPIVVLERTGLVLKVRIPEEKKQKK